MVVTYYPPFALIPRLACTEMTSLVPLPAPPAPGTVLMPFIVDDRFHSHAKVLAISLAARGLWVSAGSWVADHGTDGIVREHVLHMLGATPELTDELVSAGLWKRLRKSRSIEFHDWAFWNAPEAVTGTPEAPEEAAPAPRPEPGPARAVRAPRTAGARRVAMCRVPGLKKKLRARDGDQCRYCARPVRWGMGRAADSAVWDWAEPGGPASPENVVTACKACGEKKAGRSLKDSGMVLLAPPAPEKRYNARNASDLGIQDSNASCNAYGEPRNAYSGETAGQKRYTPAKPDEDQDRSKSSSPGVSQNPPPVPVLTSRARKAKPGSSEFRLHVIAAFAAKTLIEITAAEADALAAEVLGRAKDPVPCPISYVLTAIENAANPVGRWFPARLAAQAPEAPRAPAAPAEVEWCRECDEIDRTVYDPALDRIANCPNCHPKSFAAHVAGAPKEAAA